MTLPVDPAKRVALLCAAGLLAALLVILLIFRGGEGPPGIGLLRLLLEEKTWRTELWLEGAHINELEPWRIQESLAARAGISTGVYKGLTRRAVNAKDPAYRVEGHLLAGNFALAAELAEQLAAQQTQPAERARWRHRRADALWRGGLSDPASSLNAALDGLPEGDSPARRGVLADLASWHWLKANFRPEDPAAEYHLALAALARLEKITPPQATPAWRTALHRLQGRCLLRRACLNAERDLPAIEEAAKAFEQALSTAAAGSETRLAVLHDLGLCHLELEQPEAAEACFAEIVTALASGKTGSTEFDVRALERRVTARLNAQAFLAWARARQAAAEMDATRRQALVAETRTLVTAVHGMTLPDEGGAPWITAQAALALIEAVEKNADAAKVARELALNHYPAAQAGEPGVPSRAQIEADR